MENPIKMDDLGGFPIFLVQHPYVPKPMALLRYQQLGMTSRHGSVELLALNAKVTGTSPVSSYLSTTTGHFLLNHDS